LHSSESFPLWWPLSRSVLLEWPDFDSRSKQSHYVARQNTPVFGLDVFFPAGRVDLESLLIRKMPDRRSSKSSAVSPRPGAEVFGGGFSSSHTNHSKESLRFIPKFADNHPILRWGLERQCKQA
jgi:hypothetical protein